MVKIKVLHRAAMLSGLLVVLVFTSGCMVARYTPGLSTVTSTAGAFADDGNPASPVRPPVGFIYTDIRGPLLRGGSGGVIEAPSDMKMGQAGTRFLKIPLSVSLNGPSFAWQDAAIKTASEQAGIKKIYFVDFEQLTILGLWTEFTVLVYGE